jgi:hypothetical protein
MKTSRTPLAIPLAFASCALAVPLLASSSTEPKMRVTAVNPDPQHLPAMENDPEALRRRVEKDFPTAREPAAAPNGATTYKTPGVVDRLPVFHERLAGRMTFPFS